MLGLGLGPVSKSTAMAGSCHRTVPMAAPRLLAALSLPLLLLLLPCSASVTTELPLVTKQEAAVTKQEATVAKQEAAVTKEAKSPVLKAKEQMLALLADSAEPSTSSGKQHRSPSLTSAPSAAPPHAGPLLLLRRVCVQATPVRPCCGGDRHEGVGRAAVQAARGNDQGAVIVTGPAVVQTPQHQSCRRHDYPRRQPAVVPAAH